MKRLTPKQKSKTRNPFRGKVHSDILCELLALSDKRLRELANEGLFPKPELGMYQAWATVAGVVAYYRNAEERVRRTREAMAQEKLKAQKRENDEADGLLVKKAEVARELQRSLTPIKEVLRAQLEGELPRSMSGMDVPANRIIGKRVFDHICDRIGAVFGQWKI